MAREEMPSLQTRTEELLEKLQQKLVMADDETIGSVILEIRSGVGGDEAALFAGDLLEMYRRFASRKSWTIEELEFHGGEQGGCRKRHHLDFGRGCLGQVSVTRVEPIRSSEYRPPKHRDGSTPPPQRSRFLLNPRMWNSIWIRTTSRR